MINIPLALLLYIKLVHDKKKKKKKKKKKTPAGATSSLTGTCIWLVHYSVFKAAPVFLLTDKPIAVVPVPLATFPPGFHFKNPRQYGSLRPLQDSKPWLQPINKD